MSIIFNSTRNPSAIRWNSEALHLVYHAENEGNYDEVWDDRSAPELITSAINLYNSSGGYDIYLRNLAKDYEGYETDGTNTWQVVVYTTDDISADLTWSKSAYHYSGEAGALPGHVTELRFLGFEGISTPVGYISGVPSALSDFEYEFNFDIKHAFEFKYSTSYTPDTSAIASFPSIQVVCGSNYFSSLVNFEFRGVSTAGQTAGHRHFWIFPKGLVTQDGTATIKFRKKIT